MNLIRKKWLWLSISGILVIIAFVFLIVFGLKPGIDFKGGTLMEFQFTKKVDTNSISKVLSDLKIKGFLVQKTSNDSVFIKAPSLDSKQVNNIKQALKTKIGNLQEKQFENVGPTVSRDLTKRAYWSVAVASLFIIFYIAFSFRKIPKPANSFRFGISAVIALIHDVILVIGLFAILGRFHGIEIDSLFITALLTVLGFSVHDTIVVFDRIRENLINNPEDSFETNAARSLAQTIDRSLLTSFTVIIVLSSLLIFGGESIKWFVLALLAGIVFGTYSSIFVATQILCVWQRRIEKKEAVSDR